MSLNKPSSADSSSDPSADELDAETLRQEAEELAVLVTQHSGEDGPIETRLLPSLRAGLQVVDALLRDGQLTMAAQILHPMSRKVSRIIARGY